MRHNLICNIHLNGIVISQYIEISTKCGDRYGDFLLLAFKLMARMELTRMIATKQIKGEKNELGRA